MCVSSSDAKMPTDDFVPHALVSRTDHAPQDGSTIVEFDLTEPIEFERLVVAITFRRSRNLDSMTTGQPLVITKFDSVGVQLSTDGR